MPMLTKCPKCGYVGAHGFTDESGVFTGDFGTVFHGSCKFDSADKLTPSHIELQDLDADEREYWGIKHTVPCKEHAT